MGDRIQERDQEAENKGQWSSACLVCTKSWVQLPTTPKRRSPGSLTKKAQCWAETWTKRWHIGHGDNHLLLDWIWGRLHSKEFRPDTVSLVQSLRLRRHLKKVGQVKVPFGCLRGNTVGTELLQRCWKVKVCLLGEEKESQTIQDLASHQKHCSSYTEWKLAGPGSRQICDPVLGSYRDHFVCCVRKRCGAVTAESGD